MVRFTTHRSMTIFFRLGLLSFMFQLPVVDSTDKRVPIGDVSSKPTRRNYRLIVTYNFVKNS